MTAECEICPFLVGQSVGDEDVLLQTDHWAAVLDTNQIFLGKSFVTLREHKQTISDLSEADWADLRNVMIQLEKAIKNAFGANVLNWECLMNNAIKAKQPTHVHWKLYPRYLGGTSFEGEDFPDPKWPRHLEGGKHIVSDKLFSGIAQAIRREIRQGMRPGERPAQPGSLI